MFNLHAGDAYCYFNRHYLILKFSECASAFLKGDVIAPPIGSRTLLFPRPIAPFSTASGSCPLPALVNPARFKVQKLLRSFVRKNAGQGIAEEKRAPEERFVWPPFHRDLSPRRQNKRSIEMFRVNRPPSRLPGVQVESKATSHPITIGDISLDALRGEPLDHSSLEISDGPGGRSSSRMPVHLPQRGLRQTDGSEGGSNH